MGQRKQRSDKKREVKPYITVDLKDMIYRLSYITSTPVKDICEFMCIYLIHDPKAINALSTHFKRDIRLNKTLYFGSLDNHSINKRLNTPTERVTVRFKQMDYEFISILSYALDCSASRVVAVLLEIALTDIKVVNIYIKQHLYEHVTSGQMKELRNILKHLNRESDENSSWATLLSIVADEVTTPITRIKDAIGEFLVNIKRYDED